jgi:hypothetical protein
MQAVLLTYQDKWPAREAIGVPLKYRIIISTEGLMQLELIVPSTKTAWQASSVKVWPCSD